MIGSSVQNALLGTRMTRRTNYHFGSSALASHGNVGSATEPAMSSRWSERGPQRSSRLPIAAWSYLPFASRTTVTDCG